MRDLYMKTLKIEKVRHLKDIEIPISAEYPKHLILTGKNGSGKTSVLQAMSRYLHGAATSDASADSKCGIAVEFNQELDMLHDAFEKGEFLLAYYKAERTFEADIPKHIESIQLKDKYAITESPRRVLIKYLADLKVKELVARGKGNSEKADGIGQWFDKFEKLLREIFGDPTLELLFDEDSYSFTIQEAGREPFGFNELSSGYAAILDIVLDIIIRMENYTNRSFDFNMPGIVLIDEIETHLHVELQKAIMKMLTTVFPKIQFVVTTHSAFILNSLDDAVIYDLENRILAAEGLANVPYDGIIKSYFNTDTLSDLLRRKFERYKELAYREQLSDDDFSELAELELYLEEIPDYLAIEIAAEFKRLQLHMEGREDL